MEVRGHFKLAVGVLFVSLGLIGIFNLWDFFSVNLPWQVWPIGVIVVGVLFMVRQKGLAFGVALVLIALGIFSSGWDCCDGGERRDFAYEFELDEIENVELSLDYGVGSVEMAKGNDSGRILFSGSTWDFGEPDVSESNEGDLKKIRVSRSNGGFGFNREDVWVFELGDDVDYDLDLEYGVADVDLDFRGLKVDRLYIGQGVSDTRIVFGEHPTVARVEAGVSDIEFEFARGSGVVIEVDGGLLDKDFDGFVKRKGKWYSEGYDEGGDNVEIWFEGGVSDLSASFY